MVVKMTGAELLMLNKMNVTEIDEEMYGLCNRILTCNAHQNVRYWGKRPTRLARSVNDKSTGKLVLVHGYCAADNPFESSANKFTDALYFKVPAHSVLSFLTCANRTPV